MTDFSKMVSSKVKVDYSSTHQNISSKYSNFAKNVSNSLFGLPKFVYQLFILSTRITYALLISLIKITYPPVRRSMKNFSNETVLITGSGRGIGKELAIQFSKLGSTVVCWDNDRHGNRETMNAVLENGGKVFAFVVDVSNREEVFETSLMMKKVFIPDVTILINNASSSFLNCDDKNFFKQESENIEEIFRVNVMSKFWTIQAFLPSMVKNNRGHIVSISNSHGIEFNDNSVPYCASKFAVTGMMESLKYEFRLTMINFTTVHQYSSTNNESMKNYRFPFLFGPVSQINGAKEILNGIGRNDVRLTIPRFFLTFNSLIRILPDSVVDLLIDFIRSEKR